MIVIPCYPRILTNSNHHCLLIVLPLSSSGWRHPVVPWRCQVWCPREQTTICISKDNLTYPYNSIDIPGYSWWFYVILPQCIIMHHFAQLLASHMRSRAARDPHLWDHRLGDDLSEATRGSWSNDLQAKWSPQGSAFGSWDSWATLW